MRTAKQSPCQPGLSAVEILVEYIPCSVDDGNRQLFSNTETSRSEFEDEVEASSGDWNVMAMKVFGPFRNHLVTFVEQTAVVAKRL
jgi:hypothetical protein